MTPTQLWIAGGVGLYLAGMLAVGAWANRRVKDSSDYLVAGRRMPLWMSVGTLFATWFGAETCMGSSGMAFEKGLLGVIVDPFGAGLCLVLAGLFVCRPLYRLGGTTVVDYFEARYGRAFGKAASLLYIPVYVGWVGAQLLAFGLILESLTGLPRLPCVLLSTAVVLTYTYSGGMWAVAATDVIQMLVLLAGLLVIFPVLVRDLGGFAAAKARLPAELFHFYPRSASPSSWLLYLEAWIIVGLGSLPAQDLVSRVFAADSETTAARAAVVAGVLYWTVGLLPVLLGILGRLAVPQDRGESVLIELALRYLSPPLIALMVGALLSAIMSSADSAILAPCSIIGNNIVPYLKKDASDSEKLAWSKRSVPVVGLASLAMALHFQDVYRLCQEAWSFLLVGLTAPLLAGLYWERASPAGAAAAALAGPAVWLSSAALLPEPFPAKLLGFSASLAALALVSLRQPQRSQRPIFQEA